MIKIRCARSDAHHPGAAGLLVILALLGAHAAMCLAIPLIGRRRPLSAQAVFSLAALPPAAMTAAAVATLVTGDVSTVSIEWVAGLDLGLAFRLDALSAALALVVSGIGVAVFVYSIGYFGPLTLGLSRFAVTLLAFSGAMLGLVLSDSIWGLFVFWELTSITSYLLVGYKNADPTVQLAARRAFLITAAGGLVLLAGLVLFADATGSTALRQLEPATGTAATVAAVLVVVAAATKSAQVPFHVWLPGAMAAPTPVSAYLHSATMVKAGVILLAIMLPVLGDTGWWTPLVVAFGLASMVWGAIGALRQTDAKLILAWGTVSQLGLMFVLFGVATGKATFAAISILVAHAAFKAALFMVVGEIDVRTGTRDIRRLGGLWRSMPIAFGVALASAASMAGIPPLLGFAAKEAGIEAALGLTGGERAVVLAGIVGGSVLTVAYTVRFMVVVFGGTPAADLVVAPRRRAISSVTVPLALISVAGFVSLGVASDIVRDASVVVDPDASVYRLLRWPGLTTAFLLSVAIVAVGGALGLVLARRTAPADAPRPLGAEAADALVNATLRASRKIAATVQHGSLPGYMVTFSLVTALAAVPFLAAVDPGALEAWDHPLQLPLVALVLAAAVGVLLVPSRLGAALGLGAVGFGVAGLFVVQGAPDLALTQLLVETVIVVGFVIGLGRLRRDFPSFGLLWRNVRLVVSGLVGLAVAVGLAASASSPAATPPLDELGRQAVETGGGNNVVNVILTDIRALDTWGEIIVLVAVAVGVMSLAQAGRRDRQRQQLAAPELPGDGATGRVEVPA